MPGPIFPPKKKKKKKPKSLDTGGLPQPGRWVKLTRPKYGSGSRDTRRHQRELFMLKATWSVVGYAGPFRGNRPTRIKIRRTRDGKPIDLDADLSGRIFYTEEVPLNWIVAVSPLEMLAAQAE